ncbi:hypothetical protein P153DRAFT_428739 [Dothidotthia symphoricarpi CBS 119687]|uniref:Uncharacterized protein n=1 Tax=Dothidotthia symphoricarpi CBS 119687 TaxID=1392245 RepID=A0A6A6AP54_9PLEO|nr:uncharacterized protein P153DRAFT_428739 [Dothidotthia symphoricarpi CBS 119687]KAF2132667.1 hypothetical protein P153DRAFT_428739 [Dothidotthia symphoricarpi CBS 119687]
MLRLNPTVLSLTHDDVLALNKKKEEKPNTTNDEENANPAPNTEKIEDAIVEMGCGQSKPAAGPAHVSAAPATTVSPGEEVEIMQARIAAVKCLRCQAFSRRCTHQDAQTPCEQCRADGETVARRCQFPLG